jgi:putative ABC transport system ATP-binding protein
MSAPAPPAAQGPAVRVCGLSHTYGAGDIRQKALANVSLTVPRGELVILTGPSGCGKTTLLTLVGGLRSVQEGSVEVLGQEMRGLDKRGLVEARRSVGFIFQAHNLLEPLSAAQNVAMPLDLKSYTEDGLYGHAAGLLQTIRKDPGDPAGPADEAEDAPDAGGDGRGQDSANPLAGVPRHPRAVAQVLVNGLLTRLGLGRHIHKKPNQLSGGQKQRVAIARALINHPQLILADEPTAALDKGSSGIVLDVLQKLTRAGSTILVVTHDPRIMDKGDRIVAMKEGEIASDIRVDETVRLCVFLQQVSLFAGLTPGRLVEVAEKMHRETYPAGTTLFRQGEAGDKFYLIREGKVEVRMADGSDSRLVRLLGPSQFFGEIALLEDEPRSATVTATEPLEVYTLNKDDFLHARAAFEEMRDELMKVFAQRFRHEPPP